MCRVSYRLPGVDTGLFWMRQDQFSCCAQEDTFNAEIVRQIKERKLAAQRKRETKSTYR